MYCDHSRKYRSMYKTYTNGNDMAGYITDVFEKKCNGKTYNFNTIKETKNNPLFTLERPALISCKAGSEKDGKIYCPPMGNYVNPYECPMYKSCDCDQQKRNCEMCVKNNCLKNRECDPLCQSRAGKLKVDGHSMCDNCLQKIKSEKVM